MGLSIVSRSVNGSGRKKVSLPHSTLSYRGKALCLHNLTDPPTYELFLLVGKWPAKGH